MTPYSLKKLIVWDFDGTLVDSRPLIEAGMDHALRGLGLLDHPELRETWLSCVGLPVEEGLHRTFGPLGLDPGEVLKVYRSFDWMGNEHLLQPFPGMAELVKDLHERGVLQAIASSKRSVPLKRQVARFGWTDIFDPLITPDEVAHGKPHPESMEQVLAFHGLPPEAALMVGDTPFDLDMASGAGVESVAVGHGFYGQADLEACGPRAYAPDVAALRDILLALSVQGGPPGREAASALTHFDPQGLPRMVDVGAKARSLRRAIAVGCLELGPACAAALEGGGNAKGDPWAVVRIAAVNGVKHTAGLIPLCHPLAVDGVNVHHHWDPSARRAWIGVEVRVEGKTGVEMEALAGVSAGLLGLYDMLKAASHEMTLGPVRLLLKEGGRRGQIHWPWEDCPLDFQGHDKDNR